MIGMITKNIRAELDALDECPVSRRPSFWHHLAG